MQGTACGSKTLHWIGMRVCPKHFPETIGHLQSCTDYIKLCLFEKKQLPMGKKMNRILSKMNAIQPRPAMFCSVFCVLKESLMSALNYRVANSPVDAVRTRGACRFFRAQNEFCSCFFVYFCSCRVIGT